MKLVYLATLSTLTLTVGALAVQEAGGPPAPEVLEQHEWLQQFEGDWILESEYLPGPGAEPVRVKGLEKTRLIGELWAVSEGDFTIDGTAMTWLMTLGYDPAKEAFVGTWVDSVQTHMWTYEGQLDGAKKVLTLDTVGPSMTDPDVMLPYRERIEVVDRSHRKFSSSVQGEDGTWTTFVTTDYRRKP